MTTARDDAPADAGASAARTADAAGPRDEPATAGDATGDGVRWLTAAEQRVWRNYLDGTQLLWARLTDALDDVEGSDLSMPEYEILVRLSESPDRAQRMSELADGVVHSRSRLIHTVARMESRGLVRRESCPGDRRGVLAVLTDEGHAALAHAAAQHVTSVRRDLFDHLDPDDLAALGRIMATLAAAHRRA